jgi:hypothetical protein
MKKFTCFLSVFRSDYKETADIGNRTAPSGNAHCVCGCCTIRRDQIFDVDFNVTLNRCSEEHRESVFESYQELNKAALDEIRGLYGYKPYEVPQNDYHPLITKKKYNHRFTTNDCIF